MDQGAEERQAGDLHRRLHAQRAADFLHGLQKPRPPQPRRAREVRHGEARHPDRRRPRLQLAAPLSNCAGSSLRRGGPSRLCNPPCSSFRKDCRPRRSARRPGVTAKPTFLTLAASDTPDAFSWNVLPGPKRLDADLRVSLLGRLRRTRCPPPEVAYWRRMLSPPASPVRLSTAPLRLVASFARASFRPGGSTRLRLRGRLPARATRSTPLASPASLRSVCSSAPLRVPLWEAFERAASPRGRGKPHEAAMVLLQNERTDHEHQVSNLPSHRVYAVTKDGKQNTGARSGPPGPTRTARASCSSSIICRYRGRRRSSSASRRPNRGRTGFRNRQPRERARAAPRGGPFVFSMKGFHHRRARLRRMGAQQRTSRVGDCFASRAANGCGTKHTALHEETRLADDPAHTHRYAQQNCATNVAARERGTFARRIPRLYYPKNSSIAMHAFALAHVFAESCV